MGYEQPDAMRRLEEATAELSAAIERRRACIERARRNQRRSDAIRGIVLAVVTAAAAVLMPALFGPFVPVPVWWPWLAGACSAGFAGTAACAVLGIGARSS